MTRNVTPQIASRFDPPYTAVVFTSVRTLGDHGYADAAQRMDELAARQPGYLGVDSAHDPATGLGITVSYWSDDDAASAWKAVAEHLRVQSRGRDDWYEGYVVRVARVERDYSFTAEGGTAELATMEHVRAAIDELDAQLVTLLARRQTVVERAGELKRGQPQAAVRAPDRRRAVIEARTHAALAAGLEPDVAEAVWNAMIDAFIRYELRVHQGDDD